MRNEAKQIKDLTEDNDILENYFRNTIIPQLFVDGDLKLRKFTPPAMKQFNLTTKDIGRSVLDIKDNFRFPSIVENIHWVINNMEILEKEVQTTDMRWYQMNILPYIVHRTNRSNGVIITFVDITDRIRDLKELESLISEHEILLDTITHDIKNPLTSLSLTVELMNKPEKAGEKEFRTYLKTLGNSVVTLLNVVEGLTDSRKREYKYRSEIELLYFENVLEDVRLSIADGVHKTGAIIETEINVSQICFSRPKLRSIVYNLVCNAIKYKSPDRKPKIIVSTEKQKGFIVISVKDNGLGIESENKEKIFSKYYRVEDSVEGTGVGLFLVKEIVSQAGGRIEVESEPGKGSEFRVYLKELMK